MTFTFGKACILLLVCDILVAVLGEDDEWIDPTDMFQYDETSKTMTRKLRDHKKSPPVATNGADKEESRCYAEQRALRVLRKEIQNVKLKAHDFMEQESLNLDPGSKLAHLINSIQHLTDLNDEDFHTIPNQCLTYCIKIRTSTMMLLDRFVPELLKIMAFLSERNAHWLLLAVTLLPLFVYKLAKCFRRHGEQQQQEEPGEIERPEANQPPVHQNNGQPGEEEQEHIMENPLHMPAEVLGYEAANSEDPGQQSMTEDCYDENYELIKPPMPETQPASHYWSPAHNGR
ncbi:uncharacterized protein LOC125708577 [Brienomyrus brachyistius]|uniref:uncharacterized protein LOC125708577 n=1 Tax=Brienomyrus brachyistius TaxID=42636 RepID=UPI0020B2F85D|nr:uncharacterized protein LOC125708577 [Brienomyrus brachyistius]